MSERVDRNASDEELDDGIAEVERLRDRLRELMDRFEAMKLATLRGVLAPRAAFLNNTAAVLRALDPAARRDVLISVDREVDVREALRQIREKASARGRLKTRDAAEVPPARGRGDNSLSM